MKKIELPECGFSHKSRYHKNLLCGVYLPYREVECIDCVFCSMKNELKGVIKNR